MKTALQELIERLEERKIPLSTSDGEKFVFDYCIAKVTELLEKEREAAEKAFNQARKQTSILGEKDVQMTDYLISPKYKTFEDYWNSKNH